MNIKILIMCSYISLDYWVPLSLIMGVKRCRKVIAKYKISVNNHFSEHGPFHPNHYSAKLKPVYTAEASAEKGELLT